MSVASNLALLGVVVAGGAALVAVAKVKLANQSAGAARFKAKLMLTPNELDFLIRLEAAVPELRICPQVAMGALLDPEVSKSDGKAYYRARGMFAQKIVDFVAMERVGGVVVALIELDDRTHSGPKDAKRDAMLVSAGYRVVRWQSKSKPDTGAIRAELLRATP